jgi:hypothetical protein
MNHLSSPNLVFETGAWSSPRRLGPTKPLSPSPQHWVEGVNHPRLGFFFLNNLFIFILSALIGVLPACMSG